MNSHEPLNSVRNVSDRINPERERIFFYNVRSGILTKMCPEHIRTHIHLNLPRLPDYVDVRSEIETFLAAQQSSSNPDAMDIGSLNGQKRCLSHLWTARPLGTKRGKNGQEGKGDSGKGQGKKGKSGKGKTDDDKEKGKGKVDKWQARKTCEGYCHHRRKGGHMEKDCFAEGQNQWK